jgi:hypothetical protein
MDIIKSLHRNMRKIARSQLDKIGMSDLVPPEDAPYLIDFVQEFMSSKPEQTVKRHYDTVPAKDAPELRTRFTRLCGDKHDLVSLCTQWLDDRNGFLQDRPDAESYPEACENPAGELERLLVEHRVLEPYVAQKDTCLQTLQKISLTTERPVYNLLSLAWSQADESTPWPHDDLSFASITPFFDTLNARLAPFHIQLFFSDTTAGKDPSYMGLITLPE